MSADSFELAKRVLVNENKNLRTRLAEAEREPVRQNMKAWRSRANAAEAELALAREALAVARAQLITLGGPAVDPWSDAIQRAVLSQIDAVLPAKTEGE